MIQNLIVISLLCKFISIPAQSAPKYPILSLHRTDHITNKTGVTVVIPLRANTQSIVSGASSINAASFLPLRGRTSGSDQQF
jgi:hypothetical protein